MIDPRLPVRISALLRIALGASFILKGQRGAVRSWIGDDAGRPPATVLARALGIRDIVTAVVSLRTVDDPQLGPSEFWPAPQPERPTTSSAPAGGVQSA